MRRRIKLLSLIITFIFTATFLFGCGATPKETLFDAVEKNQQAKSYKIKGDLNLKAAQNKTTQNIKLSWAGTVQKEPQRAALDFNVEYQGISMKGNLYINNDKMYVKLPEAIIPEDKYIEFDLKALGNQAKKETTSKTEEKLAAELGYEVLNSIAEDKFKDGDKKEIDGSKLRIVQFQLSQSDFKTLLKNTAKIIGKEKYKKLFNKNNNDIQAEMKKGLEEAANTMDEELQLEDLQFNVAVDRKGYARNEEVILNFKDKNTKSTFEMTINNTLSDINKKQEFKFPAFNKNNTVPYDKFDMPFPGLPGRSLAPNQELNDFESPSKGIPELTQPM